MCLPCLEKDLCKPNPCVFGTKCLQTTEDSYQCVRNLCHPNPCANNGKCIEINEDNYACACTGGFKGKTCTGKLRA